MIIDSIHKALAAGIAQDAWATDYQIRGEKVDKFRRYVDGEHDAQMTAEMKKALRVSTDPNGHAPFNSNKCDDVIQTMADRLIVDRIEGDNDAASEWAQGVLDANRFDALQMDLHEGSLRDGDTYLLEEFDNERQVVRWCHELAWDGTEGMLVVPQNRDKSKLACAVKVWCETTSTINDTTRINFYYPDRIEKYIANVDGGLKPYEDPAQPGVWPIPWTDNGKPLGVPVIAFPNRGRQGYGLSELENVLPLQDSLNRTLHSMVMTAELTAFSIYFAKGFNPGAALTPGMILKVTGEGGAPLGKDDVAEFDKIAGSDIKPFIDVAEFFIRQIESVSRTPSMDTNANLSGEAMKQSEIKLLGKVRRFQVKSGNGYEDAMAMAHRIQTAFGTSNPPAAAAWKTVWADAEIRNDKDTVDNVMKVADKIGPKETLRQLSPVFGWDEAAIDTILAEAAAAQGARTQAALQGFNSFQ